MGARGECGRSAEAPRGCKVHATRRKQRASHEVSKHRTRLDARELVRVPEQHESRMVRKRVQQGAHEREVHHRGFVDDHKARTQGIRCVVAHSAVGSKAHEAMNGFGFQRPETLAQRVRQRDASQPLRDGFAHARGRFARGRGETNDERVRLGFTQRQRREESRDRQRLARARSARDNSQGIR